MKKNTDHYRHGCYVKSSEGLFCFFLELFLSYILKTVLQHQAPLDKKTLIYMALCSSGFRTILHLNFRQFLFLQEGCMVQP